MIIIGGSAFSHWYPAHLYARLLLVWPLEKATEEPARLESQLATWMMIIPQISLLSPSSPLFPGHRNGFLKDSKVLVRSL